MKSHRAKVKQGDSYQYMHENRNTILYFLDARYRTIFKTGNPIRAYLICKKRIPKSKFPVMC